MRTKTCPPKRKPSGKTCSVELPMRNRSESEHIGTADKPPTPGNNRELWIAVGLSLFAALAFYLSTKATLHDLDYTSQIASVLLDGQLSLQEKPPDWLNEMIPWKG